MAGAKRIVPRISMIERPSITADQALQRLMAGNGRFMRDAIHFPRQTRADLANLARGQQPFATILGCSDSRVAPERIFDAELGELFVVRVAGNVLSVEVASSLQYAGAHLQTPLFMVLGHEGCGAVEAALETMHEGTQHCSRIQLLVDSILPALADVDGELPAAERLTKAVESNVRWTMRWIRQTPEGKARLAEGWMKLVGAVYEIETGRVRLLEDTERPAMTT
jgi:carbonic anhydrase